MPPQTPQSPQGDSSLGPFWILIGIFTLSWAVWYFAHTQITNVILHIRLAEAELIYLFAGSAHGVISAIQQASPAETSFSDIIQISQEIGSYFRFPVAIILAVFAVVIYLGSATSRFKRTYSMQTLAQEEKDNWPQITPITQLDLVNTDIDQGPWAMAMSPMQFAKKYHLLRLEKTINTDPNVFQRAKLTASLNREEAYRIFSMQLGQYWEGVEKLNHHTKALFAVFAARIARDQEGANKILFNIANSTGTGKLDFSGVKELIAKYKGNKKVNYIVSRHGFVLTVMASMLLGAREDGVQAAADFLWLKPIDRRLWFMLNNVGRQTAFTEVAGSFAHWKAERRFGKKMSIPMVEEAVNALELAIQEVVYVPEEGEVIEENEV